MNWYYAVGGDRKGPVGQEEFDRLVLQQVITAQTLVWHEGLPDWQPYESIAPPVLPGNSPAGGVPCAGCGQFFPQDQVIPLAGQTYCEACKPIGLQRLKEGVSADTAAEAIRKEHLKHEASVKSIGLLYYIGGGAMLLIALGNALAIGRGADSEAALIGAVILVLAVAQLWTGAGIRRLRSWARIPVGILSGIGLLGFPIGTLINAYILYLVFSAKGKMVFSDEYRTVIEQTPHIKYRTSVLVWIIFGLLLLIIGIGIVAAIVGARR